MQNLTNVQDVLVHFQALAYIGNDRKEWAEGRNDD